MYNNELQYVKSLSHKEGKRAKCCKLNTYISINKDTEWGRKMYFHNFNPLNRWEGMF